MNKGVTPYAFGANINGTWRDLGTVSAAGVWGLKPGSILVQPTATTPSSIYSAIFPGVTFSDTVQSVRDITAGTTQENNAAIAAYVKNASGGFPSSGGNGVGIFAAIQSVANNSPVWGINTLCQDAPTRAVSTLTGNYCIGAELDFNIMSAATQVIGVSVGGNSLTQPTTSNAYLVNTLSQTFGYKWGSGFAALDGTTDVGLSLGAKSASGSNIESQNIQLGWRDGSGSPQAMVMKMSGGFLSFANTGAWNGVSVGGSLTVSDFAIFQSFVTFNVDPRIKGSSTGTTILSTANSSATNYTATLPANTGTIAETNLAQTFSANQTFGATNLRVQGSSTGVTTVGTANSGATDYTATLPANTGTIVETNLAQTFTAIQTFDTTIKLKGYTVAGLAAAHPCNAGAEGSMAYVTDATAPTYNGALTGGGAVKVPVFCDGANWTAH